MYPLYTITLPIERYIENPLKYLHVFEIFYKYM